MDEDQDNWTKASNSPLAHEKTRFLIHGEKCTKLRANQQLVNF